MPRIAVEAVCCSLDDVRIASDCGVDRVELCIGIEHGGLTPSVGFVELARSVTPAKLVAMLRHRNGDFVIAPDDLATLRRDAEAVVAAGAQGLVIGALTPDGQVDFGACAALAEGFEHLELTFHRAIDTVADPEASIEQLLELGYTRILASGRSTSALEGAPVLAEWIRAFGNRATICPAGGLRSSNVAAILQQTGASQTHQGPFLTSDSPFANPKLFGEKRTLDRNEVAATVAAVRAYEMQPA